MSAAKKRAVVDFTDGRITGKMIKFAMPLMATALLQSLYNAADMIVVANFAPNGSFAMGAVGACGSLFSLFVNFFLGLSVGVGICVAQNIGAKRPEQVKKYIHTAAVMSLICGIAMGVLGFFTAETMLKLMGTPDTLLPEASQYMRAVFVGMPANLVYNFLASALRSAGDSKRPLIFLTVSGLANVGINFLMVLGFGMGAVGVGIATTISQYLSAILIVVFMLKTSGVCRIYPRELKIHREMVAGIMQNGLPTGLQSVVFAISNVLIQASINSFGDIAVSGSGAANNIENFIYVAMNAISIATITVVSQNVGAAKFERIKRTMVVSLITVSVVGLGIAGLVMLFHEPLLAIYAPGNDATAQAVRDSGLVKLLFVGCPYFLCGIMECVSGSLKGMGRSLISMIVSIIGSCALRILWIYTVCPFFSDNIGVLYLAYPVTWIVTTVGLAVFNVKAYHELIRARDARIAREAERQKIEAEV